MLLPMRTILKDANIYIYEGYNLGIRSEKQDTNVFALAGMYFSLFDRFTYLNSADHLTVKREWRVHINPSCLKRELWERTVPFL